MTPMRIVIIVVFVLVALAIGALAAWWDKQKREL